MWYRRLPLRLGEGWCEGVSRRAIPYPTPNVSVALSSRHVSLNIGLASRLVGPRARRSAGAFTRFRSTSLPKIATNSRDQTWSQRLAKQGGRESLAGEVCPSLRGVFRQRLPTPLAQRFERWFPRAILYHRGAQTPQQLLKTTNSRDAGRAVTRWWTITSDEAPPRSRLAEKNEQKLRNLKSGVSFPSERRNSLVQVVMPGDQP